MFWLAFKRWGLMQSGLYYYNKATARMEHWKLFYYRHGVRYNPPNPLADFSLAKKTIGLYQKAISIQEKGVKVRQISRTLALREIMANSGEIMIDCPACKRQLRLSHQLTEGALVNCFGCGSTVSVRQLEDKIYIHCSLPQARYQFLPINLRNLTVLYSELGFFYRLMGNYEEADKCLAQAIDLFTELLKENPPLPGDLKNQSLTLFRRAELNHAHGNWTQARKFYLQSLKIDQELGDQQGIEINTILMQQLPEGKND
jgi:tetratricopeptide (TPR) repeat protein